MNPSVPSSKGLKTKEFLRSVLTIFIVIFFSSICTLQVSAQCSITTNRNASTLACGTLPLVSCGGSLTIGDGVNPAIINMNAALDLTCLGPIQLVIKKQAGFDFTSGNNRLTLAVGSSISFEEGSVLVGGSCNASERIYIGTQLIASCNGGGGAIFSFEEILNQGGFNVVDVKVSAPVCMSGSFVLTANPAPSNGATVRWYDAPSGGNLLFTGSTYTTPTIFSSKYYYVEAYYSSINFTTARVGIEAVVMPALATPNIAITQPSCSILTGFIQVSSPTGAGLSYSINGVDYSNTTGTFNSLPIGNYSLTVKNSAGCVSPQTNFQIVPLPVTTWNGSSWSNGLPDGQKNVVFQGNLFSTSGINACNATVNSGNVLINANHVLSITNSLNVQGGTLTFENSASLVQVNDLAVNTGNIIYKRNTSPVAKFDFTYWSSPVAGLTLFNLSPNTLSDKYFSFDSAIQDWKLESNGATVMIPGKGYIIRSPQSFSTTVASVYSAMFIGTPKNGVVNLTIPLSAANVGNFALVGNPYPSALDADKFILENSAVLEGSLYFWTHNTPLFNNIYNSNDYAVYTLLGGVGTSGGEKPNGKITAGQGFFVSLKDGLGTSANLTYNNAMRISETGQNSQFFAANTSKKEVNFGTATTQATTFTRSRLWLNLTNSQGAFSQTLTGYADGATDGFDSLYDALFLEGFENVISFFSLLQDQWLAIQAFGTPFEDADVIRLGYKSSISSEFNISIADLDGLFLNQNVFLEDKLTGQIHDLKSSSYNFTSSIGTFTDRFVIRFTNNTVNTKNFIAADESMVQITSSNERLTVKSAKESLKTVAIYDQTGRLLYQKEKVIQTVLTIPLQKSNQLLIAKIELENGKKLTKKIVF